MKIALLGCLYSGSKLSDVSRNYASEKTNEPFVPSVRGNDAQAQKIMLMERKNIANAAGMPAINVHALGFVAYTASAPSMAVESGSANDSRESAAEIHPSCLSKMY
ncbi:MAG: hypothetical protein ACK5NE_02620 [Brachymonas sp.]